MWQFISDQWYPMHEGMKIPYIQPVAIYNNHDERTGSVLMEVLPKIIDALTHTLTLLPTLPVYDEHSAVPMPAALKYKKAKLATMEVEDTN
jgi:hypothetical protein